MPAVPPIEEKKAASNKDADDRVGDFFGEIAPRYANHYSGTATPVAFFFHRRQTLVMNFLRRFEGGVIIDVGCGPGVYAKACLERGFRYQGLDASPGMIDEGRNRLGDVEGAEFVVGDARRLPYPADSFDAALCLGVLEYVPEQDEAICLQELTRVVKPGGVIVFSFLNASSPYWLWVDHGFPLVKFIYKNFAALMGRSKWTRLRDCKFEKQPTRRFKLAERVRAMRRQRLSIEHKKYFALNIFPAPLDRLIARPCVWVSSTLEPLLSVPLLGWLGTAFVVLAQKPAADATQMSAAGASS